MWIVAGVLLGLVVLFSLLGLHLGPHSHAVAGILGALTAAFFVAMIALGRGETLLYLLLGADLATTSGTGYLAWRGVRDERVGSRNRAVGSLEGIEGVATSDLDPHGVVRVGGETWSATSLDGTVRRGAPVHVVRAKGVRLEVLGTESLPAAGHAGAEIFHLEPTVPELEHLGLDPAAAGDATIRQHEPDRRPIEGMEHP